jgi:hypothetical protein
MSDIIEAIQDAVNPKRREEATAETYDAQKRGPYADRRSTHDGQPEVAPPNEIQNPGRAEQNDPRNAAASQRSGPTVSQTLNTTTESRQSHAMDPCLEPDKEDKSSHGLSDYGEAAVKPVHKEGGKYGLS